MITVEGLKKLEKNYKSISQYTKKCIDEECEEQESNMGYAVAQSSLVEKQQRHFNNRLRDSVWKKEEQLRLKHTHKEMVETEVTDWSAYEKDTDVLRTNRHRVEDIIMIGDPIKMFEAVDAFEKMTIH